MKHNQYCAMGLIIMGLMIGTSKSLAAGEVEKGTSESPSNAKLLAGSYYRGDGLGMNIALNLKDNMAYAAEWHGCLGKYGESSGKWTLANGSIAFKPSKEMDMMKGHLKSLEVMKFKGDWILVPTERWAREFYEKSGVSLSTCYQKSSNVK